jgi:hypothetical protein
MDPYVRPDRVIALIYILQKQPPPSDAHNRGPSPHHRTPAVLVVPQAPSPHRRLQRQSPHFLDSFVVGATPRAAHALTAAKPSSCDAPTLPSSPPVLGARHPQRASLLRRVTSVGGGARSGSGGIRDASASSSCLAHHEGSIASGRPAAHWCRW